MKYNINITKNAEQDLREIYKYIAETLLSPQMAINQLHRIEKAIFSLDNMPTRHKVYDDEISFDIRLLPVNNYCIFYIVNEENYVCDIVRVLYGGRNFDNIL